MPRRKPWVFENFGSKLAAWSPEKNFYIDVDLSPNKTKLLAEALNKYLPTEALISLSIALREKEA